MRKPIRFLVAASKWLLAMSLFLGIAGCTDFTKPSYTREELQQLVNQHYLSPQIRTLELLPMMSVQVYLETPELDIKADEAPLAFTIKGSVDAEVLGAMVTDPIPLEIRGTANLDYVPEDQAFYFTGLELTTAQVDLELAMLQAMIMEEFSKALRKELLSVPIISLDEGAKLFKQLGQKAYRGVVREGRWQLEEQGKGLN